MKIVSLFILIALSGRLSAQVVFGNPTFHILYYGYENSVDIGTVDGREFVLKSDNIQIKNTNDGFVLIPSSREEAELLFIDPIKGNCFDTIHFEVRTLPAPELYFGAAASGEKVRLVENHITARYGAYIPLRANFKVIDISSVIGEGSPITQSGNIIGDAMMTKLKALKPGDVFTITVTVQGSDGLKREIKGSWKL
jgi:hypothetical protein